MATSFRNKYKNKKGGLGKQHQTQNKNRDAKGKFPSIILRDQLPAGVELWRCKEGDHLIDIIPWAAGPDMPFGQGDSPSIEEGDLSYVLDLQVHQNIGSMKVPFVCPYENFGQPCPICEFIKENDLDKEDWKKLSAKRRVLYLVWVHNTREDERKGIQLWEISHFSMEEKLNVIAALPRGGGSINFSDFDDGKTIAFTRKGSGQNNTQYLGHRFIDRESKIPDRILDATFSIDQVVKMHPTYEEIDEAFKGQRAGISSNEDIENAGSSFDDSGDMSGEEEDYDENARPGRSRSTGRSSGRSTGRSSGRSGGRSGSSSDSKDKSESRSSGRGRNSGKERGSNSRSRRRK